MSNTKNNGFYEFILGKGFYFVLALCVAGAGIAGWMAINRPIVEEPLVPPIDVVDNAPNQDWNTAPFEEVTKSQPEVPATPPLVPPVQAPQTEIPVGKPAKEQPQPTPATYSLPIQGEVLQGFTGDNLIKSETLGDWRTHNGMDIKCEKGTNVIAMTNGKVIGVSNDPLWGYMVTIDHGNNIVASYCGLEKNIVVTKGTDVKAGQVLGKVDYIASESKMPIHLHFEVKKSGKYIDPTTLIK